MAEFAAVAGTVLGMDMVYLNCLPFREVLEKVQGGRPMKVRLLSAVLCYAVLVLAIVGLAPRLGVAGTAAVGAAVYGVYELTNHATLDGWPAWMVGVDTAWGALLFAAGAAVALAVVNREGAASGGRTAPPPVSGPTGEPSSETAQTPE